MLSMRYKNVIIAFVLLLAMVLFIREVALAYENSGFRLEGSYVCKEQRYDWFSFERDGSNMFRYYSSTTGSQTEDIGTFIKVSERKYILSSSQLDNIELICYKKFPNTVGFHITLNGVKYNFIQTSIYPSQISSPAGID